MSSPTPAFTSPLPLSLQAPRAPCTPLRAPRRLRAHRTARFGALRAQSSPSEPPEPPERRDDSSDPHDIPQSAVDWNAEWTSFKQSGMKSDAPQGRQPLTSQQRAQRNLQQSVARLQQAVPSRQQLFSDWKFWVAVILGLSLLSAFVQSTNTL